MGENYRSAVCCECLYWAEFECHLCKRGACADCVIIGKCIGCIKPLCRECFNIRCRRLPVDTGAFICETCLKEVKKWITGEVKM